ncbi:transmembrane emp24 domain-containing protein p24delta4-like [Henckelia pumila]|uniref:transmembrane emp24 domain-containing protein p24delta4-like n=1 Tax=Henckelia pumila TaxID=405737 RepID=UPI003C6E7C47
MYLNKYKMKLVEAAILLVVMIPAARGLWLNLPSSGTKCVSEELHNNVVVLGDYSSFFGEQDDLNNTAAAPTVSVKVTSPYGSELYHQEKVSNGQFAFTASETGSYMACFTVDGDHHGGKIVTVGIDWKTGIAAKDWDSVARKEKIEGLELELTKLEGIVQAIHENLNYLISREVAMREVSEKTNARVVWYSIVAFGVCIVAAIFQLWYLRRYFQKKKLI